MMRADSASPVGPPNIIVPRQSRETFSPLLPREVKSIVCDNLSSLRTVALWPAGHRHPLRRPLKPIANQITVQRPALLCPSLPHLQKIQELGNGQDPNRIALGGQRGASIGA